MGESAEGKGLGRVWQGLGDLGEDRRVVGDIGGWGDFGRFGIVGKVGWETGLSKAYPLSPYQNQSLSNQP